MNFSSHMDAVVTVAVRLVNLLTAGEAHGRPYPPPQPDQLPGAVTGLLRATRRDTRDVTADEAAEFEMIAGSLRAVFEAVADGRLDDAAGEVNALLQFTGARPRLDRHDDEPWHLHFHGADESLVTGWAAGCATGLAVVLGSDLYGRLECARRTAATGSTSTPRATEPAGSAPPHARTVSRPPPSAPAAPDRPLPARAAARAGWLRREPDGCSASRAPGARMPG